jgi:hypothetical protein
MPSRSALVGLPIGNMNAILGAVTAVSLITAASGTAQNGYKMPTDFVVITAANGSNTAVTLPDPYLQNWNVGDSYKIVNASTQACVIFPPTGGNINGAGANSSIVMTASQSLEVFVTGVASGASTFTSSLVA